MSRSLRQTNITLMIVLFLLNFALIVLSCISFAYLSSIEDENPPDLPSNIIYMICCIALSFVSIFLIAYFGCKLIYFKMLHFIKLYYLSLVVLFGTTCFLIAYKFLLKEDTDVTNPDFIKYDNMRFGTFGILAVLGILYIINFVVTYFYIKQLHDEIELSPLNQIDEGLSLDLYNNIINQSKDPSNPTYKSEYNRLSTLKTTVNERKNSV